MHNPELERILGRGGMGNPCYGGMSGLGDDNPELEAVLGGDERVIGELGIDPMTALATGREAAGAAAGAAGEAVKTFRNLGSQANEMIKQASSIARAIGRAAKDVWRWVKKAGSWLARLFGRRGTPPPPPFWYKQIDGQWQWNFYGSLDQVLTELDKQVVKPQFDELYRWMKANRIGYRDFDTKQKFIDHITRTILEVYQETDPFDLSFPVQTDPRYGITVVLPVLPREAFQREVEYIRQNQPSLWRRFLEGLKGQVSGASGLTADQLDRYAVKLVSLWAPLAASIRQDSTVQSTSVSGGQETGHDAVGLENLPPPQNIDATIGRLETQTGADPGESAELRQMMADAGYSDVERYLSSMPPSMRTVMRYLFERFGLAERSLVSVVGQTQQQQQAEAQRKITQEALLQEVVDNGFNDIHLYLASLPSTGRAAREAAFRAAGLFSGYGPYALRSYTQARRTILDRLERGSGAMGYAGGLSGERLGSGGVRNETTGVITGGSGASQQTQYRSVPAQLFIMLVERGASDADAASLAQSYGNLPQMNGMRQAALAMQRDDIPNPMAGSGSRSAVPPGREVLTQGQVPQTIARIRELTGHGQAEVEGVVLYLATDPGDLTELVSLLGNPTALVQMYAEARAEMEDSGFDPEAFGDLPAGGGMDIANRTRFDEDMGAEQDEGSGAGLLIGIGLGTAALVGLGIAMKKK